ncbi:MAG: hypothetical protein U5Q44_06575 [Dehalococcoidia bacterium]|nr:hypothetical protein [Dehalococcoidia bacterium]
MRDGHVGAFARELLGEAVGVGSVLFAEEGEGARRNHGLRGFEGSLTAGHAVVLLALAQRALEAYAADGGLDGGIFGHLVVGRRRDAEVGARRECRRVDYERLALVEELLRPMAAFVVGVGVAGVRIRGDRVEGDPREDRAVVTRVDARHQRDLSAERLRHARRIERRAPG